MRKMDIVYKTKISYFYSLKLFCKVSQNFTRVSIVLFYFLYLIFYSVFFQKKKSYCIPAAYIIES